MKNILLICTITFQVKAPLEMEKKLRSSQQNSTSLEALGSSEATNNLRNAQQTENDQTSINNLDNTQQTESDRTMIVHTVVSSQPEYHSLCTKFCESLYLTEILYNYNPENESDDNNQEQFNEPDDNNETEPKATERMNKFLANIIILDKKTHINHNNRPLIFEQMLLFEQL